MGGGTHRKQCGWRCEINLVGELSFPNRHRVLKVPYSPSICSTTKFYHMLR